ncbi:MAG: hypothetical protein ACREPE_12240 [Lysobacter sp.]
MTPRLVSPLLLASLLTVGAFSASAQTVGTSVGVDASVQTQSADVNADATFDANAKPEIDRNCLKHTGSRIVARYNAQRTARASGDKTKRCVGAFGRVYSREDLDSTGEVDIADALRKLDPSIH